MAILIKITAVGDQLALSQPTAQVFVPRSPMSGTQLPPVIYRNDTQWELIVQFTSSSPFTESMFPVSLIPGEYKPTWSEEVAAQRYLYVVSEDGSKSIFDKGGENVKPVNGDITITVQT